MTAPRLLDTGKDVKGLTGRDINGSANPVMTVSFAEGGYQYSNLISTVIGGANGVAVVDLTIGTANGRAFHCSGAGRNAFLGDTTKCSFQGVLQGG